MRHVWPHTRRNSRPPRVPQPLGRGLPLRAEHDRAHLGRNSFDNVKRLQSTGSLNSGSVGSRMHCKVTRADARPLKRIKPAAFLHGPRSGNSLRPTRTHPCPSPTLGDHSARSSEDKTQAPGIITQVIPLARQPGRTIATSRQFVLRTPTQLPARPPLFRPSAP